MEYILELVNFQHWFNNYKTQIFICGKYCGYKNIFCALITKITNVVKTVCMINYRPQEQLRKGNFSQVSVSHSVYMGVSISVCLEGWACLRDGYVRGLGRSMSGQGVEMSGWEVGMSRSGFICPGGVGYVQGAMGMSRGWYVHRCVGMLKGLSISRVRYV